MTSRRKLVQLFLAWPLTVVAYGAVLVVTGFVACGLSGCGGGGFGPSFDPVQAQAGLLVAGLVLVPAVLVTLDGRLRLHRLALGAAATLAGSVLAMVVLDLGPHGCPLGQSRAAASAEAFDPGAPTCSGDDDALP